MSTEDFNDRYDFAEPLLKLIKTKRIDFYSPKDTASLSNKIKLVDNRIGSADREILMCAAEDNADVLVTIDKDMISNRSIENLLGIKVLHPKNLL